MRATAVLIGDWISDADADTKQRLVDAAIGGSHEALVQAVAGGLPESYPALRRLVDDAIHQQLAAVPADAFGSDGINGWHEAARFAAHASAAVRSALIERAYSVLANDRQDDNAVVTALVTIAVVASHDPPVIWPSRATQLYDAIAGLARGEPRHGPPRDPHAMPMKEDSLQASAVQACVYLARRSGGERSEAGRRLLEASCHSRAPEVQRIANALTSDLDDAS